ncbi:MAG: ABC transporter ATP-binding protein [Candidatus Zixiibacteriota bacterium]|nr:MAG: ABC transporter ATP-binding protein [candidate division Zixibacteria bacterium]
MSIVEVDNLTKTYGSLTAVSDFSFRAERGELIVLMGPDGAGKTTTFRAVCGLITLDSGRITVAGHDVSHDFKQVKPILGYMPQVFSLYPDLSVEENLRFYAGLFGLKRREYELKRERLYEFSGLEPFASRRVEALSGGMKQKLALSCSLIHDPQVLILDEPTTGVDPLSRRQFWDILRMLKARGAVVIVSTPYMDEAAKADRAIFLFNGKCLAEGTPRQLAGGFQGMAYRADRLLPIERLDIINAGGGIAARRFGTAIHIYLDRGRTLEEFTDILAAAGLHADTLTQIKPELEDAFIQLMDK